MRGRSWWRNIGGRRRRREDVRGRGLVGVVVLVIAGIVDRSKGMVVDTYLLNTISASITSLFE